MPVRYVGGFYIKTGKILKHEAPYYAGRVQIFFNALSGQGNVTLTDYLGGPDELFPEHWGAKADGVAFTASITSGQNILTSSSGLFTSSMVGRKVAVFSVGTALAFASTISGFTSSTQLAVTDNAGSTFTSKSGIIGTDDTEALKACLVATRGLRFLSLAAGKIYCVASNWVCTVGTGRGWKIRGRSSIVQAVAAISGGMFTNDPGTDTSVGTTEAVLEGVKFVGSNLAQDGLFFANWSYPNKAAGFVGRMRDVSVDSILRFPLYAHPCQEAHLTNTVISNTGKGVR